MISANSSKLDPRVFPCPAVFSNNTLTEAVLANTLLMDAAVRDVKGNLTDKAALRKAIAAAKFESVRGAFKFNSNGYPIQDYYLRVITKDAQGRITNRTLGTVFKNHADAYVGECKMPAL